MLAADRALAEHATIAVVEDDAAAQEYRALGCAVEHWEFATLVHLARTRANVERVLQTHTRGVQFARGRMRALQPDVVVTNSENVWFGGMAARSLGVAHLQVVHALTLEHHWGGRPFLVQGYLRWLQVWNDSFVGVSQTVVEMLTRNGVAPDRVARVRNGLNLQAIRTASLQDMPPHVRAKLQGHSPILVTLGRISALKGHDLLIEALARVHAEFPNFLCLLGGAVLSPQGIEDTTAFYARLQARIMALGLQDHVVFLGEIDFAPALLRCADVYVQPSRSESFCRAVVEALVCNVPVAAFCAGALPEVLGEGGVFAPPEDGNALADVIVRLLTSETLRARVLAAGQAHVTQFDITNSVRDLRTVLNGVSRKRMDKT